MQYSVRSNTHSVGSYVDESSDDGSASGCLERSEPKWNRTWITEYVHLRLFVDCKCGYGVCCCTLAIPSNNSYLDFVRLLSGERGQMFMGRQYTSMHLVNSHMIGHTLTETKAQNPAGLTSSFSLNSLEPWGWLLLSEFKFWPVWSGLDFLSSSKYHTISTQC